MSMSTATDSPVLTASAGHNRSSSALRTGTGKRCREERSTTKSGVGERSTTQPKGNGQEHPVESPHLGVVVLCMVRSLVVQEETVESVGLALLTKARAHGRAR